jgi:hypothetical protein
MSLSIVRDWFALYLSEQRKIAASLGLPPQGQSSQMEWSTLVLTTAKERGELPRVAEQITVALEQRRS